MDFDKNWRTKNFRDVGYELEKNFNIKLIPRGRLYRGGEFDIIHSPLQYYQLGFPQTILNLRAKPDNSNIFQNLNPKPHFQHEPIKNDLKNYDTSHPNMRNWIRNILHFISELNEENFPLYIHCRSGKDRTGIVIAILLIIIGVDIETVVKEYLLTKEGSISEESIRNAIAPYSSYSLIKNQCKKTNLEKIISLLKNDLPLPHPDIERVLDFNKDHLLGLPDNNRDNKIRDHNNNNRDYHHNNRDHNNSRDHRNYRGKRNNHRDHNNNNNNNIINNNQNNNDDDNENEIDYKEIEANSEKEIEMKYGKNVIVIHHHHHHYHYTNDRNSSL